MNRIPAKIIEVFQGEGVSQVDLEVEGDRFTALTLETPESDPHLKMGERVEIFFKETEVAVARDLTGRISLRNRMEATVRSLEKGVVLTRVLLDYRGHLIQAVITTRSAGMLELESGVKATALIKATEISLRRMEAGPTDPFREQTGGKA